MYFFPLQNLRRTWATTLEHSTSLDRSQAGAFNTLDASPHPTWGSAHFYSYHHAIDWRHRTRTRSGNGQWTFKDCGHARLHAPHCSVAGTAHCSSPIRGKETTSLITHACNSSHLEPIKGGGAHRQRQVHARRHTATHTEELSHSLHSILALASISNATLSDLGASLPLSLKLVPPTTSTPVQDNTMPSSLLDVWPHWPEPG